MRIVMIGTGYVGLVSGACFAEFGHDVVCVDRDADRIEALQQGHIPIYEPGLDRLVAQGARSGRLCFSNSVELSVTGADAIFLAVGTPTRRGDGHADMQYVMEAASEVALSVEGPTVVVTKSTVPVGTGRRLQSLFAKLRPDIHIDPASNPEFLREGSAIEDFMRPDRVVCGVESDEARARLAEAYRPLNLIETPILFTGLETAELIKYASNAFLATKITFINELADLCESVGADIQAVAKGVGMDGRIGRKFLHAGPGYGGSCFPKDTLALVRTAEQYKTPLRLVETVIEVNERRKRQMVAKVLNAAGGTVADKTIAVLGVTFKPNTDDMRDAPSLVIIPALQAEGAEIRAYDPAGQKAATPLLPKVNWCADMYDAVQGADLVLLLTEWNEFRGIDFARVAKLVRNPVLVDLRNALDPKRASGFAYTGVGRGVPFRHLSQQ